MIPFMTHLSYRRTVPLKVQFDTTHLESYYRHSPGTCKVLLDAPKKRRHQQNSAKVSELLLYTYLYVAVLSIDMHKLHFICTHRSVPQPFFFFFHIYTFLPFFVDRLTKNIKHLGPETTVCVSHNLHN